MHRVHSLRTDQLVFFAFDLLHLKGEGTAPGADRRKQRLFGQPVAGLRYGEHVAA
jgi:ATP-dependent DNA ligase